ncbi:potassium channel family protein [soil metagenome]
MVIMRTETELSRWEHRAEWPLAAVALVFLVAYSVDVLATPTGPAAQIVNVAAFFAWAVFAVDYVVRLILARDRSQWFLSHLLDLAIVVLPLLRPLRLLRLVVLVGALQKVVGNAIRGRVVVYTVSGAVLLVYVASLAVLEAERGAPEAHITNFGEALWWALTTITTVGYGDLYPVTTTGRVIAALLMIGGISLLGTITATIASWIVQRVAEDETEAHAVTAEQTELLRAEIRELRDALDNQVVTGPRPG